MNWISVGEKQFKIFEIFKIEDRKFSALDLKYMLYAQAKFGGPLAITTSHDNFINVNEYNSLPIKNICLFRNDGVPLHVIPKESAFKIVGMDFIEEEYLLVFMQEGSYLMIDPHRGIQKLFNLGERFMGENIIEAKIVDNGVVFYTNTNGNFRFYLISDIFKPEIVPFIQKEIKIKPSFFIPISPRCSTSSEFECLITHPLAGFYRLTEKQIDQVLYNAETALNKALAELPNIKEIIMMAASPNQNVDKQNIALLTKNYTLYIISATLKGQARMKVENCIQEQVDSKTPLKLFWCGEDAVVINIGKKIIIVNNKGVIYTKTYGGSVKAILAITEIDGLKIITNKRCEILRELPENYVNIFKLNSTEKSKDLFEAYEEYEARKTNYENSIIVDKKGLQDAVEQCIDAGCFELNPKDQERLLKAAHYGKVFLNPTNSTFDHVRFTNACRLLRVISSLRQKPLLRAITFEQFISMDASQIIRILIRYQLYYLADEICKFLEYPPKLVSQIYLSWACAKIEAMPNDSIELQEIVGKAIYEKLKDEKNISFAQIARRAIEFGKIALAIKLLDREKSLSKKVHVLLEIQNYAHALREALASRDPNMVELVIVKMHTYNEQGASINYDKKELYSLVDKSPISRKTYINFLRGFNKKILDEFMFDIVREHDRALYFVMNSYQLPDFEARAGLLEKFALKTFKDKFFQDLTKDQIDYLKILKDDKNPRTREGSIKMYVEECIARGNNDKADEMRKKFKISDRSFYSMKICVYVAQSRWTDLDNFAHEKRNKKTSFPWFALIDHLVEKNQFELVEKYINKLPDIEEQVIFLCMIARFKTAADVAFNNKKYNLLDEVQKNSKGDPQVKEYIEQLLIRRR